MKNLKFLDRVKPVKILRMVKVKDVIDVVIVGSGLNYYKRIKWDCKIVEINGFKYNIDRNHLFITPRNVLVKFKDWIRRRRNVYQIVFREKKPEAVALPPLSRRDPSGDILFIAERSTALKKGLDELFSSSLFSGKVVIFIVIAVGILSFAYLYATDQLPDINIPL